MRLFRSRRRPVSWIALFALSLQFFLSFGHIHSAHAAKPFAFAATSPADARGDARLDQSSESDDLCAICILNGLIRSAVSATPPDALPPRASAIAVLQPLSEAAFTKPSRAAFRSRAPPIA